ncbi:MAG: hypothetical protein ED556_11835 [Winogradskyella sp.]|uniref:hypothetical protein n=1 Tax=Winogradskyella sp. TaxID=1883156 RepID=UPI000F3AD092|nr:hypothetical protein [Winogradskyella sp.]RNC84143.1 MAG: hypothetical protein ED556_11835 [Winogradskyella sp.]
MAKNKKNKDNKYFTLENAIDTVSLVNTVALTTTEKVFDKGFETVEKLQSLTDKLLKKGFKFSAKQHDVMFDALEDTKEKAVKTYKKVSKRFNKKAA